LKAGAPVDHQRKGGFSAVFSASQGGHTDVVDLLIQEGADIHLATTKSGTVPLGIAATLGQTETVQRLLEAGANLNYQNKNGITALLNAAVKGHVQVVRLLLEKGASVNICNKVHIEIEMCAQLVLTPLK
jgi:ankyrin repeat protein